VSCSQHLRSSGLLLNQIELAKRAIIRKSHLSFLGNSPFVVSITLPILLANLFQRNTAAVAASDSPCSLAFNDGICEA
jgi:hypothetical protein